MSLLVLTRKNFLAVQTLNTKPIKVKAPRDLWSRRDYFQRTYPSKGSYLHSLIATEMDDYIRITTWFVRQVLDAYETWNGKDNVPPKIQEPIMVLQIEASPHHHK